MSKNTNANASKTSKHEFIGTSIQVWLFLMVPLLDELTCGFEVIQLPAIRSELHLSCARVAFLLTAAGISGAIVEPLLFSFVQIGRERRWIQAGMVCFGLGCALMGYSAQYPGILAAFIIVGPMSGLACGLSQARLVDLHPTGTTAALSHWTLSGSAGDLLAPLALGVLSCIGFTWRHSMFFAAALWLLFAVLTRFVVTTVPQRMAAKDDGKQSDAKSVFKRLKNIVQTPELLRWGLLLESICLLDELLLAFSALYLHDELWLSNAVVNITVAVFLGGAIVSVLALPFLTRRFSERTILFVLSVMCLGGCAMLVLIRTLTGAVGGLLLMSASSGLYPILKAQAFRTRPENSADVVLLLSLLTPISLVAPRIMGIVADVAGLRAALLLTTLSPISILLFTPRLRKESIIL